MASLLCNLSTKQPDLGFRNVVSQLIARYAGGKSNPDEFASQSGQFLVDLAEAIYAFVMFAAEKLAQFGLGFNGREEQRAAEAALKQSWNIHGISASRLKLGYYWRDPQLYSFTPNFLPVTPFADLG